LSIKEGWLIDFQKQIELIKDGFTNNRKLLIAIGDKTRQNIIIVLMGNCEGLRVGEITLRTHLSRPAVSHHLRILLDCGLVSLDKQGTRNFYSLNIGEEFQRFFALVGHIAEFKKAWEAGSFIGGAK
jgi:ArsR family transcriptional regulator